MITIEFFKPLVPFHLSHLSLYTYSDFLHKFTLGGLIQPLLLMVPLSSPYN